MRRGERPGAVRHCVFASDGGSVAHSAIRVRRRYCGGGVWGGNTLYRAEQLGELGVAACGGWHKLCRSQYW